MQRKGKKYLPKIARPVMQAYGKPGTINAADIENVAAYVLKKADAGW